jgi:hypothetical protein
MAERILSLLNSIRPELKKSRFKIWLRTFLLIQFSGIFIYFLYRDISNGYFYWRWVIPTLLLFVPIGFLMSHIVPMQTDKDSRSVTLSLDRIYLILIWLLVIVKVITGQIPSLIFIADVIMCAIIGIMSGRLSGICLRVNHLKIQHGFIT